VPLLAARPQTDRVIGVDRRPLSSSSPKLQFVQGRPSRSDLFAMLEGVDVALHLATSAEPAFLRDVLDAAAHQQVRKVIVLSSATVFGAWRGNPVPLPDDAPLRPNPSFWYAVQLAECERMSAQWATDHPDVTVTVLRLATVLGGGLEKRLSAALGGTSSHREVDSSRPVQFLHIDDAVRALELVVDSDIPGHFNVAPVGFVGDATAREVAGTAPRPGLPRRLARVFNAVLFRRKYRADLDAVEAYLRHPWVVSSDRFRAAGWQPAYSSEEALVAEAVPTWWGGLAPGRRRALVSGGMVTGSAAGAGLVTGVAAAIAARSRRKRPVR
jgi:nucleoside-diphosphate-sugar epimerase